MNRWTLGYRPALAFLKQVVAEQGRSAKRLHIVDVGSGDGEALRRISAWARREALEVELTGVDLNPYATRAAREFCNRIKGSEQIRWITGNALDERAVQNADVVISSLVTHHMRDAEVVEFLRWMERTASRGWFVNDLQRSAGASKAFRVLAKLMRWHPFVQHDGPVSFRRAFQRRDWQELLERAEIPLSVVRLTQPLPGRLCVTRLR